jgi:prepilin peptidase CpaA
MGVHSFAWWPTLIVLAVATFTDLRSRRIPNWLVLPFLVAGIAVSGYLRGWPGVGYSFEGLGLGLLVYGVLFFMGGMGAGDVKLCAALGAWIWPHQLLLSLVFTAMAGGIMVLVWLLFFVYLKKAIKAVRKRAGGDDGGMSGNPEPVEIDPLKRKMPYAPAIAVGTLLSFFAIPR